MKNKIFMFALGATVGSLVTWKLVEKKYKDIADEEIASMEEYYNEKLNSLNELAEDPVEESDDINKAILEGVKEGMTYSDEELEYDEHIKELNYNSIQEDIDGIFETEADIKEYTKPYVISPEEFGEYGNETKLLTYYADFVLVDEEGDIIVDPESVVGDALEHFGEYEDDAVHVRDENIECDYEILKHEKTFGEVYKEEN